MAALAVGFLAGRLEKAAPSIMNQSVYSYGCVFYLLLLVFFVHGKSCVGHGVVVWTRGGATKGKGGFKGGH